MIGFAIRIAAIKADEIAGRKPAPRHICKNTEHKPRQQKNAGQKNEDQTRFNRNFSARHFSAFELGLAGEPDLENVS